MLRPVPIDRFSGLDNPQRSLSEAEAITRRSRFGTNNILDTPEAGWRELLADTVRDPMLWFLVFTGSLFAVIGELKEAITIFIALIPLAGMDMFLHRRTRASTASLGSRLASTAIVIRNGKSCQIPSEEIVCGDLVALKASDTVPADGLIVEAQEVQIDESALSGEAFPVRKRHYLFNSETTVPEDGGEIAIDGMYWGFAGSRVLTGRVLLRVVFTGRETYYGEIVQSALQGRHARTPLQDAIGNLVSVLLVAAAIMCLVVAWIRWQQGFGLLDATLSAMTLAVAALPEEFPVVFSFFLGVGVYRLARQRALVRRAVAVENIGRVTTICCDKTGTLTQGRLSLTHTYPAAGCTEEVLLQVARFASRSNSGDPLDEAILSVTGEAGTTTQSLFIFPFTEDRKKETAIVRHEHNLLLAMVKGAPEVILQLCHLPDAERDKYLTHADQLAEQGHKVIACAQRRLEQTDSYDREPDEGFEYVGLLALEDPVREGVVESVAICQQAGIHVIMITGDHPLTARAVALQLGLGAGHPQVVTAEELETQIQAQGRSHLQKVDVIARCIPMQKLHIVRQLQADGEIVSVTGDGVNDVPALQAADIGIAMGERGTRAAREVAAVVLMDDNFRTIMRAISEGFQLFRNLRLSFAYLLMLHIPLVVSAAAIPLGGYPLLYLPVHIVWLELIIHPTALLVFQQLPTQGKFRVTRQRGRPRFYTRSQWLLIALVGGLLTLLLVGGYAYSLGSGRNVEHARAMALAILCLGSAFITACLSRLSTGTSRIISCAAVLSAVLLIQVPVLAGSLHLQPLHWIDWMIAAAGSGLVATFILFTGFTRDMV